MLPVLLLPAVFRLWTIVENYGRFATRGCDPKKENEYDRFHESFNNPTKTATFNAANDNAHWCPHDLNMTDLW